MFVNAEIEFLELLVKTCKSVRNPKRRVELAVPAAQWEMRFEERIRQLKNQTPQKEFEVAA